MCLLDTSQLLRPWRWIGNPHPRFLLHIVPQGTALYIMATEKNLASQRYDITKENVMRSNSETELPRAGGSHGI